MKKNVGTTDRIIRLLLSLAIFAAGLYYKNWWGLIGFVPLITGAWASCPLYAITMINTRKRKP